MVFLLAVCNVVQALLRPDPWLLVLPILVITRKEWLLQNDLVLWKLPDNIRSRLPRLLQVCHI